MTGIHFRSTGIMGAPGRRGIRRFFLPWIACAADLCMAVIAAALSLTEPRAAGARFLSRWRQRQLINRRHDGFLIDGSQRAISRKQSFQNVLVLGKVGTGKSTVFALPNIYHLEQASQVILDTSGELYEQTAGDLARRGYDIQVLDLMTLETGLRYNPFTAATDTLARHKVCASIMRAASLNATDAFWDAGAVKVLRVLASVLHNAGPELCTLVNLRSLLAQFDVFSAAPGHSVLERYVLEHTRSDPQTLEDYRALVNGNPNTVLSFVSTADTALTMLASEKIAGLTAETSFDFQALRRRPTALFVKVRQQDMEFFRFLLNQFFADLFDALRAELPGPEDLPVFCLLDEWGQLDVPGFDSFISTARKYRVGCMIFLQALEQLEARYGRAKGLTIRQSLLTELYFGGVDLEVAKQLERRLGRRRIPLVQQDQTVHREENLMNEDRIIRLPEGKVLVFYANQEGFVQAVKPFYSQRRMRRAAQLPGVEIAPFDGVFPSVRHRLEELQHALEPERENGRGAGLFLDGERDPKV